MIKMRMPAIRATSGESLVNVRTISECGTGLLLDDTTGTYRLILTHTED
jgi:hypothetical protein